MRIRQIIYEDVDEVIEMGIRMHDESNYAFLPFDREKVRELIMTYVNDFETQCGLVAEEGNFLLGMFGGFLTDYYFCNEKLACDMVLFIDKKYRGSSAARRLIRAFRDWAIMRGAREICLGISSNVNTDRTGRFYESLGFTRVGAIYKQRSE